MTEIKLKKKYKYAGDIFRKLIDIGFDIKTATDFLNEVADADVVPVVRCKDCKHWNNGDCYRIELTRPDDYCSYGEKESNNEL